MDKKLLNRKQLNKISLGTRTIKQISQSLAKNQKLHEDEELILASLEEIVKHEKLNGKEKKYNTVYLLVLKPWYRKGEPWMYSGKHGSNKEFFKTSYFGNGKDLEMTETEKRKKMTRHILKSCKDAREMAIWETYIHTLLDVKDNKEHFNIIIGPLCSKGSTHSDETKAIIRLANLGKKHTPERVENNRRAQTGKKLSPETKEKLRLAHLGNTHNLGKKHTPETKKKLRIANLGRKHSLETKEKCRLANLGNTHALGYKHTPETKEKLRLANLGKTHTPETKEKCRLANLGNTRNLGRKNGPPTPETKEKLRLANLGKKHTEKSKAKMSEVQKELANKASIKAKELGCTNNKARKILKQEREEELKQQEEKT